MKKIKFTVSDWMKSYHSNPDWKDGDIREVEDAEAERLTTQFAKAFSYVDEVKIEKKSEPIEKLSDKSINPDKSKDNGDKPFVVDEKSTERPDETLDNDYSKSKGKKGK